MKTGAVSIIVPAYNEEKSIGSVLRDIKTSITKTKFSYEIIVVDDGSKDKTAEKASSVADVRVVRHPRNTGYGAALKTGLKEAKNDWVLITDADGTYPPGEIPGLLEHIGDYDMVVGSRTGNVNIPLLRRPAKFMLSKMANFISGQKIPDLNSGMRLFKKDLAFKFFNIFPDGFSFTSTITLAALCNSYRVKYVPINYRKRVGKSSMKASNFFGFVSLLVKMAMYFRPMKVFMSIAAALLLIGLATVAQSIYYIGNIADLSVILLLMSLQVGVLGMLADIVVKSR